MIQPAARCSLRKAKTAGEMPPAVSNCCPRLVDHQQAFQRLALMRMLIVFLRRTIGSRVVLIAIDVAADLVLLMVDLSAFLAGQVAAVGGAIGVNFLVDRGFFTLEMAGFARRQLTRANALADASLLVAFAGVHAAHRSVRGTAVIFRREVRVVHARGVLMRNLHRRAHDVRFTRGAKFFRICVDCQAARTAVEAGVNVIVHDYGAVDVDVVHDSFFHMDDCGVVGEAATAPLAANEADTAVPEAVVNAAIEADVGSPIASVPGIYAATPTPVTRSPEQADARRCDPNARYPVVASGTVRPIAGRPHIALNRARRLFVNGNGRRRDADRNADRDLSLGRRRSEGNQAHGAGEQQVAKREKSAHKRVLPKGPL